MVGSACRPNVWTIALQLSGILALTPGFRCPAPAEFDPLHRTEEDVPMRLSEAMLARSRPENCSHLETLQRSMLFRENTAIPPPIILVLGTSMTLGRGLRTDCVGACGCLECAWPARFERWLNLTYAPDRFSVVNGARGATSSDAAARSVVPLLAERVVLERVALVILDFVVVDGHPGRRGFGSVEASHGALIDALRALGLREGSAIISLQTLCMDFYQVG